MKYADSESHVSEMKSIELDPNRRQLLDQYYDKWIKSGLGGDDKPDNYGYFEGRLVKIDYN
jgi:hypothetical protein